MSVGRDGVYVVRDSEWAFERYDPTLSHRDLAGEVLDATQTIVPATSGLYVVADSFLWRAQDGTYVKLRSLNGAVVAVPAWHVTP